MGHGSLQRKRNNLATAASSSDSHLLETKRPAIFAGRFVDGAKFRSVDSPFPRPQKGSDSQIEKNHNHHSTDDKSPVIRPMEMHRPGTPESRGKDQHRQKKENSGDFEPKNAPDAAKRTNKSSQPAHNSTARRTRGATGSVRIERGSAWQLRGRICCGLRARGSELTRYPSRNAQTDSQSSTEGVSFHSVMMLTVNLSS
jgi:hypothetical protein